MPIDSSRGWKPSPRMQLLLWAFVDISIWKWRSRCCDTFAVGFNMWAHSSLPWLALSPALLAHCPVCASESQPAPK